MSNEPDQEYVPCRTTFQPPWLPYEQRKQVWCICERPKGHEGEHFGSVRQGQMPGVRLCKGSAPPTEELEWLASVSDRLFCGCALVNVSLPACNGCGKVLGSRWFWCPIFDERRCGDCAAPHEEECGPPDMRPHQVRCP